MKEMFSERLEFLQNNFYSYGEYALVGTKGYCYEGKDTIEHFEKLRSRGNRAPAGFFGDGEKGRIPEIYRDDFCRK